MSKTHEQSNMHLNIAVAKIALSQHHVPTRTKNIPYNVKISPLSYMSKFGNRKRRLLFQVDPLVPDHKAVHEHTQWFTIIIPGSNERVIYVVTCEKGSSLLNTDPTKAKML